MLEILEKRRDALWKKEARLNAMIQQANQQEEGVKAGVLFESCEILSRLRLYSDYESLQKANEQNIENILNEIVAEVREEQDKAFNYFEARRKAPEAVDFDPYGLDDMQFGVLRAIELEATDLLALFSLLGALALLEVAEGQSEVDA